MTFTKKDLRHIISKNRYVIKKHRDDIDKMRKKKTKSDLPEIYGRVKLIDYTNTEDFKLGEKL